MKSALKWILFCCAIAALGGCASKRATEGESVLFPTPPDAKAWLMTQVVRLPDGQTRHYGLLMTHEGAATAMFATRWDTRDSTLWSGQVVDPQGSWSNPGRWPQVARAMMVGDSSNIWETHLDRRSLWVSGKYRSPKEGRFEWRSRFGSGKPLEGMAMGYATEEIMIHMNVLPTQPVILREGEETGAGKLAIVTFEGLEDLQSATGIRATCLLMLHRTDGGYLMLLLQLVDGSGPQVLLAEKQEGHGRSVDGEDAIAAETVAVDSAWQSPASGKVYPLGWKWADAEGRQFLLRPRALPQEMGAGRRAFWMGAVSLTSETKVVAAGNMYIFTR